MPILASFGTANDRSFGFGDSSYLFIGKRVTVLSSVNVDVLLVGGGGGGNHSNISLLGNATGGGGGAGGVIETTLSLTAGVYDVVIGNGGKGNNVYNPSTGLYYTAANGENSTFASLIAYGGGYGGGGNQAGGNGGSGGGGGLALGFPSPPRPLGGTGVSGQGHDGGLGGQHYGGSPPGGGGGAGGAGSGFTGGIGYLSSISGTSSYYAGGGGGGPAYTNSFPSGDGGLGGGGKGGYVENNVYFPGQDGTANTGGGGGGGSYQVGCGSGGSGIVILRLLTADDSKIQVKNGIKAVQGLYTIYTFTTTSVSNNPSLDYSLPSIITTNAKIIYDASNPSSYNGSGTTWYDISGNGNHATWTSSPPIQGYNNNQYLTANASHILHIPDALTSNFVYFMLVDKAFSDVKGVYNGNLTWQSDSFLQDGCQYFVTSGSGSNTRQGNYVPYESLPEYILYRWSINGGSAVTERGGITTYYTCSRDFSGTQHSKVDLGTAGGSSKIKFLALYETANAPTITQAYNALKGRFNL